MDKLHTCMSRLIIYSTLTSFFSCANIRSTSSLLLCDLQASCQNRQNTVEKSPLELTYDFVKYNCMCDKQCFKYGDCCIDAQDNNTLLHQRTYPTRNSATCRQLTGVHSYGLDISVVDKCEEAWPEDIHREFCERPVSSNLRSSTPVSNSDGVLFANVYCYICNGQTDSPIYWLVNVTCSKDLTKRSRKYSDTNLTEVILKASDIPYCEIKFSHPTLMHAIRFCKPAISMCSDNWTDDYTRAKCTQKQGYISLVYENSMNKIFKNQYCAECNNAQNVVCRDYITPPKIFPPLGGAPPKGIMPLSVLVDFNSKQITGFRKMKKKPNPENIEEEIASCPYKHVFNPVTGICQEVVCAVGFIYQHGRCQQQQNSLGQINASQIKCSSLLQLWQNYSLQQQDDNSTILVLNNGEIYRRDDYVSLENGTILLCTNYSSNYSINVQSSKQEELLITYDKSQTILSLVGQLFSIVALTIHLFVYALLPSLRNLAGKNLMSLVGSLLAAQMVFLFGLGRTEIYEVCVVLACAIHYFFLASFFWMSVMSFDIWHTFSRSSRSGGGESNTPRFIRYSVYGWVSPLIIVMVALILDLSLSNDIAIRPGYGENICWFTNKLGLIVFFALPLAAIILSNLLFYCFTVYSIQKISESSKIATGRQSQRCRFLLYIKLCMIMGLTWIFAFIATLAKTPIVWYIFIILNSYQGLFICLTFVLTKNVLKLLEAKFRKLCSRLKCCGGVSMEEDIKSGGTRSTRMNSTTPDLNKKILRFLSKESLQLQSTQKQCHH